MRALRYAWEEAVTSLARGRWTLLLTPKSRAEKGAVRSVRKRGIEGL